MKDLLRKMFQGWILHEKSWDPDAKAYTRSDVDCMIEACGGKGHEIEGQLVHLFGHWGNDIQALAPFFGIRLARNSDGTNLHIVEDVPSPPSEPATDYFWDEDVDDWRKLPKQEITPDA